ncbi:MAG: hypothetical protein OXK76_14030 [Gammaproteobacteria bacterium]|nr:hypothetical protein [Gammaproteobacteria bacterium]
MANLVKLLAAYCGGLVLGVLLVLPALIALLSLLFAYPILGLALLLVLVLAVVGRLCERPRDG